MQPKDRRLVTEQNLEDYTEAELEPVNKTIEATNSRLRDVETMAGLGPGDVTDAQTANLLRQPGTSTRAVFGETMADEVQTEGSPGRIAVDARSAKIADDRVKAANIPAQVSYQVAETVAGDPVVLNSVAQRVLSVEGIVTGAASVTAETDTVWAHATEPAHGVTKRLPLGYQADGHLDEFARRVWLKDTEDAELTSDSDYRMVRMTPEGHIIYAEKWDGTVLIPGLEAPTSSTIYADVPNGGGKVVPARTDSTRLAVWGSSTMHGAAPELQTLATSHGMTFYPGGQGAELVEHHAARMGAIPAKLVFPNNTMPTSGTVMVTVANMPLAGSLKPYTGTITTAGGETIHGTLEYSAAETAYTFTRTGSGGTATVKNGMEFIPDDGMEWRNATTLIQAGKNNLTASSDFNEPVAVARKTLEMVHHTPAFSKRVLVIGQFVNTGTPEVSSVRDRIYTADTILKDTLGPIFVDVHEWITSGQIWDDAGITPTAEDQVQQTLGNLPPSVGSDAAHFNATGNAAYRTLIERTMTDYGWITN